MTTKSLSQEQLTQIQNLVSYEPLPPYALSEEEKSFLLNELDSRYSMYSIEPDHISRADATRLIDALPIYGFNETEARSVLNIYNYTSKSNPDLRLHHEAALYAYQNNIGIPFKKLNTALRNGTEDKDMKKMAQDLNEALTLLPNFEGTVYRGIRFNDKEYKTHEDMIEAFEKMYDPNNPDNTEDITAKQFWSTSKRKDGSFGGLIHFVIDSKTGKELDGLDEYEVIFGTNVKFKRVAVIKGDLSLTIVLSETVDTEREEKKAN